MIRENMFQYEFDMKKTQENSIALLKIINWTKMI